MQKWGRSEMNPKDHWVIMVMANENKEGTYVDNYLQEHQLFQMNSFFDKKPQRKWTWISPDGKTKNEIDFIISNGKDIVHDDPVLNKVSIGSDHRMIRAKLKLSVKKERQKMITKAKNAYEREGK